MAGKFNLSNVKFDVDAIGITLIASTTTHILRLDLLNKTLEDITTKKRPRYAYYGVTWSHDHLYVVDSEDQQAADCVRVYDKQFFLVDTITCDLLNTHQIQYFDGALYIADTSHDTCKLYNVNDESVIALCLPSDSDHPVGTLHHNSVYIKDENLYLLCHGRRFGSMTCHLDLNTHEILDMIHCGQQAHNVCEIDGKLVMNSSGESKLIDTDNTLYYETIPGRYLRGLAVTNDYIFVGESRFTLNRDERTRVDGGDARCYIAVLDRTTHELLGKIRVPDAGIYEIRVLSENDYAHSSISNEFWT